MNIQGYECPNGRGSGGVGGWSREGKSLQGNKQKRKEEERERGGRERARGRRKERRKGFR